MNVEDGLLWCRVLFSARLRFTFNVSLQNGTKDVRLLRGKGRSAIDENGIKHPLGSDNF